MEIKVVKIHLSFKYAFNKANKEAPYVMFYNIGDEEDYGVICRKALETNWLKGIFSKYKTIPLANFFVEEDSIDVHFCNETIAFDIGNVQKILEVSEKYMNSKITVYVPEKEENE